MPAHPDLDRTCSISTSNYPTMEMIPQFPDEAEMWNRVQLIIQGSRSAKQQSGISSKEKLDAHIRIDGKYVQSTSSAIPFIKKLANLGNIVVKSELERPGKSLTAVGPGFEVFSL